jgi:hypothetical protein
LERYAGANDRPHIFCRGRDLRVRRSPLDALHIKLKTLAEVATVPLPSVLTLILKSWSD